MLEQVNQACVNARKFGENFFDALPPLRWNSQLARAVRDHGEDMAKHHYLAHERPDGKMLADRVMKQQYRWRSGENIAAGQAVQD